MPALRVAIIGLGRIGAQVERDTLRQKPASHLGAWWAHRDRCEIVGLCDIVPHSGAQNVPGTDFILTPEKFYTDYEKMLTEVKADIVSIATPDETHRDIARNTIRYDNVKLVLLEKPIARTIDEADDIIRMAKEFNVKVAINHTRRWDPLWRGVAEMCLDKPAIGMTGYYGGDKIREGIHMADLYNWFAPRDRPPEIAQWEKNSHITHLQGQDYLLFEVDIFFHNERLRVTDNGSQSTMYKSEPSNRYDNIRELSETCQVRRNLYPGSPMFHVASQCLDAVQNEKEQPRCTAEDGKKALATLLEWPD